MRIISAGHSIGSTLSAPGGALLPLVTASLALECTRGLSAEHTGPDEMVDVFRDGELLKQWTFDEVRERAALTR